jgi:hypothetical protein
MDPSSAGGQSFDRRGPLLLASGLLLSVRVDNCPTGHEASASLGPTLSQEVVQTNAKHAFYGVVCPTALGCTADPPTALSRRS